MVYDFTSYCEQMMIPAEESYRKMRNTFDKLGQKIVSFERKAKQAERKNPEEAKRLYNEAIEIVRECRSCVEKEEASSFDKLQPIIRKTVGVLGVVTELAGMKLVEVVSTRLGPFAQLAAAFGLFSLAGKVSQNIMNASFNDLSKKDILKALDQEEKLLREQINKL